MRRTYFSPAWRSPTPFLQTISWRPQVIILQPVAAYPCAYLVLAWSRATRPVQVLIYILVSLYVRKQARAYLFLLSERLHKLPVGNRAGEIRPPVLNAGVCQPAGNFLPLEAKTRIDREEDAIQKSTPRSASGSILAKLKRHSPRFHWRFLPPFGKIYSGLGAR
jgi:hypothetical protein